MHKSKGILDVPNTFVAGLALGLGMNAVMLLLMTVLPVMEITRPFIGIVQFLYLLPVALQHWIEERRDSSKGLITAFAITFLVNLIFWFTGLAQREW